MPTHNSLELLEPGFQALAQRAIRLMETDPELRAAGVVKILPRETLRDLEVQMAYRSRSLWKLLGEREELKTACITYVREMFAAAGLWVPTDRECLTPSTNTLQSKHLVGRAADIAPSKDGKTPWWNAPDAVWNRMGAIIKQCGMRWGGDFPGLHDKPHMEA